MNIETMGIFMLYSVFFLFSYVKSISALTSNHTVDRLDHIEKMLKVEIQVRKNDSVLMIQKLEDITTILYSVLDGTKMEKGVSRKQEQEKSDGQLEISNAHQTQQFKKTRFRREMSKDSRKKEKSKTYERIESTLEQMSKEIEILKQETLKQRIDSEKLAERLLQNVTDNFQDLRQSVDLTKDTVKTISLNVIDIKETMKVKLENVTDNVQKIIPRQFQERSTCPDVTPDFTESTTKPEKTIIQPSKKKYKSCLDLYNDGFKYNGIFYIEVHKTEYVAIEKLVYCDMTTDNGGWTVFQRRQDGSVDFYRGWDEYKYGFGDLDGEFWLGNEYVNFLTDDGEKHELRVDLQDHEESRAYAKYSNFKIGPEDTNYTLQVSGYTGSAGDSLEKSKYFVNQHNGTPFSTKDRDNDFTSTWDCAYLSHGAWWFNSCAASHLNGLYLNQTKCTKTAKCIFWSEWKGYYHNLKFTEMKLR